MGTEDLTSAAHVSTLEDLMPTLANLIFWLLIFSGSVAVVIIIIAGIRFIISGGEAKTVDTAKKQMTYAILGLLLVFLSFMILSIIGYATGAACLGNIANGTNFSFAACPTSGH